MYWKNKKNKTREYLDYQETIHFLIGDTEWPFGKEEVVFLVSVGVSNRAQDIDNVCKPLFDTYQQIYPEFNDNKVYGMYFIKDIVPKGEEYLDVTIRKLEE